MDIKEVWRVFKASSVQDMDMQKSFKRACTPNNCIGILEENEKLQQENQELKAGRDQKIKELRAQNYRLAGILLRYKDYIEEGMNQVFIEKLVNKYSSKQSLKAIQAEAIKEAVSKLERPDVPLAPVFILNTDLLEYADNLVASDNEVLKGEG